MILFFADLRFVEAMLMEGDQEILLGWCAGGVAVLVLLLGYSLAREIQADLRRRRRAEHLRAVRELQERLDARFPRAGAQSKQWDDASFFAGLRDDREGRDS